MFDSGLRDAKADARRLWARMVVRSDADVEYRGLDREEVSKRMTEVCLAGAETGQTLNAHRQLGEMKKVMQAFG